MASAHEAVRFATHDASVATTVVAVKVREVQGPCDQRTATDGRFR